jgi:hypothetical protein
MKGVKLLLLIVLVFALSSSAFAQGCPGCVGVVDGYITDPLGATVSGATVTVTIQGCSGAGCSGVYTSEGDGYYVVGNLNLNSGDTVSVSATKGSETGSNSGTASGSVLRVNVQICAPPTAPTLVPQSDSHSTASKNLNWTNVTLGYYSEPLTDQINFDGAGYVNATSPYSTGTLTYKTYTWYVRSVGYCASSASSDTFQIYNDPPSKPNATPEEYTDTTETTLEFEPGVDPESDVVYHELQLSNESDFSVLIYNVTNLTTTSYDVTSLEAFTIYYWRVRTCDGFSCSDWDTDIFFTYECPGGPPGLLVVEEVFESARGGPGVIYLPGYIIFVSAPSHVFIGDDISFLIDFRTTRDAKDLEFEIVGPEGFEIESRLVDKVKGDEDLQIILQGEVTNSTATGENVLTFVLARGGEEVLSKEFSIFVSDAVTEAQTILLEEGSTLDFTVKGVPHTLEVVSVRGKNVDFKIYSEVLEFTLELGDKANLDFDDDGIPDVEVFLFDIIGDYAKVILITEFKPAICGDNVCQATEDVENCLQDCHCGDELCQDNFGEDYSTCPVDFPGVFFIATIYWALVLAISVFAFLITFWFLYFVEESHNKRVRRGIRNLFSRGLSSEKIEQALLATGWLRKDIKREMARIRERKSAMPKSKSILKEASPASVSKSYTHPYVAKEKKIPKKRKAKKYKKKSKTRKV